MSLDVLLETENGRELARAEDAKGLLLQAIESCHENLALIRYIDPYGDTVFNQVQAKALLKDLKKLETCTEDGDTRALLRKISDMSVRVATGVHLYLKVYGD